MCDARVPNLHKIRFDSCLLGFVALISALQFGIFPVFFYPSWFSAGALVLTAALTEPLHYGLMHESMHGNLLPGENWNRRAGRALGITLGLPWETMRFGHLAHHGFNRHDYDRPEAYAAGQSRAAAAIVYFFKLVIGNSLLYAIIPFLLLLPVGATKWMVESVDQNPETAPLRAAALRTFSNPERRHAVQFDLAAIVALDVLAVWLWGAWWPVFVATIAARWFMLSLLDNAPHYGMPLDSGLNARNTRIPRWASWLVLNQNFHDIHHHNPQLYWRDLPGEFAQSAKSYDGSWFGALLRQFRGPLQLS
jgi:fatty acid desaturase